MAPCIFRHAALFHRSAQKRLAQIRHNLFAAVPHFGMDDAGINKRVLLAAVAAKMVWGPQCRSRAMNTIKILGFAAVTALSLGFGTAMAQEGPNATVSGSTYFRNQVPVIQGQAPR